MDSTDQQLLRLISAEYGFGISDPVGNDLSSVLQVSMDCHHT